jgi:exodeoxyribonuclease V alpha subunit
MDLSPHQQEQLSIATSGNVGVLTGSAGTGKSHTLAYLLSTLERGSYRVVAPTGKAASRLNAELSCGAMTIHSTLRPQRSGHDSDGWSFMFNESFPLECDWLFLDEAFMVSTDIMSSLLRALKPGTKVLFTGDPYQLSPVGHGRPVYDMLHSGVIPHGHLTEVWRYAGRIASVANSIKDNQPWSPSSELNTDLDSPENYKHIECRNHLQVMGKLPVVIEKLFKNRGYDPMRELQVICWTNEKGSVSRKKLNHLLQGVLNSHGEKAGEKENIPFRVNDKIMCLQNHWRAINSGQEDPFDEDKKEVYISNGEIGYSTGWSYAKNSIKRTGIAAEFVGHDVEVKKGGQKGLNIFDLAYCVTCHKFQGAQARVVIVIADDGADRVASRQGWYTAMTRACDILITMGSMATIKKQCRRVDVIKRKTFLQQMLQEEISGIAGIEEDLMEV